jgi:flagellar hook-length control protein FliK
MVQLTKVDGEMLVKITATTQAAKEALESNVRQLRHMFSPQQVVIEKQDPQQVAVEKQAFQQNDDQMSESSDQNNQNSQNDSEKSGEEVGLSFEEVLINERV